MIFMMIRLAKLSICHLGVYLLAQKPLSGKLSSSIASWCNYTIARASLATLVMRHSTTRCHSTTVLHHSITRSHSTMVPHHSTIRSHTTMVLHHSTTRSHTIIVSCY